MQMMRTMRSVGLYARGIVLFAHRLIKWRLLPSAGGTANKLFPPAHACTNSARVLTTRLNRRPRSDDVAFFTLDGRRHILLTTTLLIQLQLCMRRRTAVSN